jgi:hypothetical protein
MPDSEEESSMRLTFDRRRFVLATGSAASLSLVPSALRASEASPGASPHAGGHDHGDNHDADHDADGPMYLAVGDTDAGTLAVYTVPGMELAGALEGVSVSAHAGFLPLGDGGLLFVDDAGSRLVRVDIVAGTPEITGEVSVPGHVAHIAVDSDHAHYCAVGTSGEDEHQLHMVNLESWEVTSLQIPDADEVGLMMTHDHVFHRNSSLNQVEAYAIPDLLEGAVSPLSTVPIGAFGHGEAVNPETGELYMATNDGVDIAYWDEPELVFGQTWAWPETEPMARGYFTRLSFDQGHLVTYTSDRSAEETAWDTWKNTVVVYDAASGESITTDLGDGYTFRFALSEHSALFYVLGGNGDEAVIIDLDPESAAFGSVSTRIALEPMTGAATVGSPFYEVGQYRSLAITPDGHYGYVTQGGDGVIVELDLAHGEVREHIDHASALNGGGTMVVFGPGAPFVDTIGR